MNAEGDQKSERRPLMVLVVDDEPGFRRLLEWELQSRGMRVETAENGAQAVQKAGQTPFDVIITDLTMPEMNGLQFLQHVRRSAPATAVILATGFGTIETAVFAMTKGAFDFITKPYDLDYLIQRVHQAVDGVSRCRSCGRLTHEQRND